MTKQIIKSFPIFKNGLDCLQEQLTTFKVSISDIVSITETSVYYRTSEAITDEIVNLKFDEEFSIEVKRFYTPFEIIHECTECGESITFLSKDDYFSYPSLNVVDQLSGYCENCDIEFVLPYKLKMNLEVYPKRLKKL